LITEQDLIQAIAECQGERNPNANTCIKLAAFLTIKNELFGSKDDQGDFRDSTKMVAQYSYDAGPQVGESIDYNSDTDFGRAVNGKNVQDILSIIDELMSTLEVVNRRLYDAVMRRL